MAAFVHRNRLVLRNSYRYGQAAPVQRNGDFLDTHSRFAMTIVVGNHSPEAKSEEIITLPESLVNVWLSPKRCARAWFTFSRSFPNCGTLSPSDIIGHSGFTDWEQYEHARILSLANHS
jgi:hypothetical protein